MTDRSAPEELRSTPFDDDKLHEECGVFGIYGHPEAAALVALGLHALQHRGQEAAGIVTYENGQFFSHRAPQCTAHLRRSGKWRPRRRP